MKAFPIVFLLLSFSFFGQVPFSDITLDAGIDNIYDVYQGLFGGGVVAFDYNNDGKLDIICGNYGTYDTTGQQIGSITILENTGTNTELDGEAVSEYMMKYAMKYKDKNMKT